MLLHLLVRRLLLRKLVLVQNGNHVTTLHLAWLLLRVHLLVLILLVHLLLLETVLLNLLETLLGDEAAHVRVREHILKQCLIVHLLEGLVLLRLLCLLMELLLASVCLLLVNLLLSKLINWLLGLLLVLLLVEANVTSHYLLVLCASWLLLLGADLMHLLLERLVQTDLTLEGSSLLSLLSLLLVAFRGENSGLLLWLLLLSHLAALHVIRLAHAGGLLHLRIR